LEYLIILVIIIGLLVLFIKFFKQMLIICGVLIIVCGTLWYLYITIPEQKRKAVVDSVSVTVAFSISSCSVDHPLIVAIKNNSTKTVTKVSWELKVYKPEYSTDIAGYDNHYFSDKILKPREVHALCYKLPSTLEAKNLDSSLLEYEIPYKYVDFKD